MKLKQVSKQAFDNFISNYGKKLEFSISHISEPPVKVYCDNDLGRRETDRTVARVILEEAMKGHPGYKGSLNRYYIPGIYDELD